MTNVSDWLQKKETLWSRYDWLVVMVFLGYSLVVWWPTRRLPHWWDAFYVVENTQILVDNRFWPVVGQISAFARPPLMLVITGLAWLVGGQTLLTSHLVMLPALPLLLVGTYLIGKRLATPLIGFLGALAVGITPVVLAEYGVLYVDIYVGALTTMATALLLHRRWVAFSVVMTLAVLMKESALMLLPSLALFVWWFDRRFVWQRLVWLSVPGVVFGLWLAYHQLMMGWWLVNPERATRFGVSLLDLSGVLRQFLLGQGMIGMSLLFVIAGVAWWVQGQKKRGVIVPFLVCLSAPLVGLIGYSILGEFALRYAIFVMPFFMVGVFGLWSSLVDSIEISWLTRQLFVIVPSLIAMGLLVRAQHPPEKLTREAQFAPPHDLRYLDMIAIFEKAADFIASEYPEAAVYGAFPENSQLTHEGMGYVNKPMDFSLCSEFSYDPAQTQVVYLHLYSPVQRDCHRLAQQYPIERVYRSQAGGRWLEIVRLGSGSAEVDEENE